MSFTRLHPSHKAMSCPAWGTHGPLSAVSPAIPMLSLFRRKHTLATSFTAQRASLSTQQQCSARPSVMVTATQSAVLSLERDVDADDDDEAAEFVEEEDEEEESLGGLSGFENLSDAPSAAPLIHPTVMYQPKLDLLEVKALKGQAETLAREKRLLKVQVRERTGMGHCLSTHCCARKHWAVKPSVSSAQKSCLVQLRFCDKCTCFRSALSAQRS